MRFKAKLLPLLGVLPALGAHAEAGKGLSRISTGEILFAIFFFGFGIPAGLGLLVYLVIKLIDKDSKISPGLIVFISVLVWWLGWGLAFDRH
jgi:hypothetical protein